MYVVCEVIVEFGFSMIFGIGVYSIGIIIINVYLVFVILFEIMCF